MPLLTSWHSDGGVFVTLPLVYIEHPDRLGHNLGMYRIQRFDDTTTGVHWQIHRGGGNHYFVAERKNQALPLTLFIGGPPGTFRRDYRASYRALSSRSDFGN